MWCQWHYMKELVTVAKKMQVKIIFRVRAGRCDKFNLAVEWSKPLCGGVNDINVERPIQEGLWLYLKSFLPVFCVSALSCPSLSSPSNGNVALSSGNLVGSTATYSCNSGYKTTFTSTRYCQADGQWSGGEASCIRKCSPFFSLYWFMFLKLMHRKPSLRFLCWLTFLCHFF